MRRGPYDGNNDEELVRFVKVSELQKHERKGGGPFEV